MPAELNSENRLRSGTVRVFRRTQDADLPLGTGFIAHESGLIVTCAHVLGNDSPALGSPPLYVEFASGVVAMATMIPEYKKEKEDIAVLQVEGGFSDGLEALKEWVLPMGFSMGYPALREKGGTSIPLRTFGYPKVKGVNGLPGFCEVIGTAEVNNQSMFSVRSNEVTHGFSGGPVWDVSLGAVVGVIASIVTRDAPGRMSETAFFIPIETVRRVCPMLELPPGTPYKSLNYFEASDHEDYFGREAASKELLAKLDAHDFVSVVGASGSGKSSLVRAGLKKADEEKGHPLVGWKKITFKAGPNPLIALLKEWKMDLADLAAGMLPTATPAKKGCFLGMLSRMWNSPAQLEGPDELEFEKKLLETDPAAIVAYLQKQAGKTSTLLICDQFERIYTDLHDPKVRAFFLTVLAGVTSPKLKVVIALRVEYRDRVAKEDSLKGKMGSASEVTLRPMTLQELESAIVLPARRLFRDVQPSLVQALVSEVKQPNDLPLLQFALTELWTADQAKGVLTHESYLALGKASSNGDETLSGLTGAVIRRADSFYNDLGKEKKKLVSEIFSRLVAPISDSAEGSRRVLQGELDPAQIAIANDLANEFLFSTGSDPLTGSVTFEVAHEVLIRSWDRLRIPDGQHAEWAKWNDQVLVPEFKAWWSRSRHPDDLIQSPPVIKEVRKRLLQEDPKLRGEVRKFAQESVDAADARAKKLEQDKKKRRRQRMAIAVMAVVAIVAGALLYQSEKNAKVVSARDYFQRGILALQSHNSLEAAVLFAKSMTLDDRREARERLIEALGSGCKFESFTEFDGNTVAICADGTSLLVHKEGEGLKLVDGISGKASPGAIFHAPGEGSTYASCSADGKWMAWETHPLPDELGNVGKKFKHAFHVRNTETNEVTSVTAEDLLPKDPAQPNARRSFPIHTVAIHEATGRFAFGDEGGNIKVFDLASLRNKEAKISIKLENYAMVFGIAFSPDGRWLASGGTDYNVNLWDLENLSQPPKMLKGHADVVYSVVFSPDSKTLASGSTDSTVRLWDVNHPESVRVLSGDQGLMNELTFDRNGYLLAGCGEDQSIRVWDIHSMREVHKLQTFDGVIRRIKFASGSLSLTAAGDGGWCRRWTLSDATVVQCIQNDKVPTTTVCFSESGNQIFAGDQKGRVRRFDLTAPDSSLSLDASKSSQRVCSVALNPTRNLLAWGGEERHIRIYDLKAMQERIPIMIGTPDDKAHQQVFRIAFSAAGDRMIFASMDGSVHVYDIDPSGNFVPLPVLNPEPRKSIFNVSFGNTSDTFASGGGGETFKIWKAGKGKPFSGDLVAETGNDVWGLDWSRDGTRIATGSEDRLIRVWNAAGEPMMKKFEGHTATVLSVAFGNENSWLASGANDHTTRLWNLTDGKSLVLRCSSEPIWWVNFSPDGNALAATGLDGVLRIWNIRSIEEFLVKNAKDTYKVMEQRSSLTIDGEHHVVPTVGPMAKLGAENPMETCLGWLKNICNMLWFW